jgi:hypothetical protein
MHEVERAPRDSAFRPIDEITKLVDPVPLDEGIGILCVAEQSRLENTNVRRRSRTAHVLDSARHALASWSIVVKNKHDRVEAESSESRAQRGLGTSAADSRDRREPLRAKVMDIQKPLDEDDLPLLRRRQP